MHEYLIDLLCCPSCHGNLEWNIEVERGDGIHSATVICSTCQRIYFVKDGIGIFINEGERDPRKELYQQLSGFMQTKDGKSFIEIPFEDLNPADRLFQSYMFEIDRNFEESQEREKSAMSEIYSEDYKKCWDSQIQHIVKTLSTQPWDEPIIDLASGRGILAEQIATRTKAPIVVSDISPTILERDKKIFEMINVNDRVDFLACDIRFTPFRTSSVSIATTNLGFQNVGEKHGQVDDVLKEVRRMLSGTLFGVANFYDPNDLRNGIRISELGLSWSFYREDFLRRIRNNGFEVKVENVCTGRNEPTPVGDYFKEASIDSLPVESTLTEWVHHRSKNSFVDYYPLNYLSGSLHIFSELS